MVSKYTFSLSFFLLFLLSSISAQTRTGVVRGHLIDASTLEPIAGVQVIVSTMTPQLETRTDTRGEFFLDNVPIGRHDLTFFHPDYESITRPGVLINSAKELVLEVSLEPRLYELDEVAIMPPKEKGKAINTMAPVSALSFDVEETRKFAGGLDDPTRLAANMPGITPNAFISDNMISIRGNSPRGLLYRLQGIDIPNPNHFARIGSSGGSFTLFSIQMLDNSDFFVGAWPAEYGNASAGVFDMRFREGNNRKREYTFQAGVLGVDFSAEGPFKEGGGASYLVNYRFSSLNLVNRVISYVTVPTYSDLSFNLVFPTEKAGKFTIFGMGGLSQRPNTPELDSAKWENDLDRFNNILRSNMGVGGITHTLALGKNNLLHSALVGSATFLEDNKEYLENDLVFRQRDFNQYTNQPLSFTTSLRTHLGSRLIWKTGVILNTTQHDFISQKYDYVNDELVTRAEETGRTYSVQAYTQAKIAIGDRLFANLGVHSLHYSINGQTTLEPRVGLTFEADPEHLLSIGYGLHSQQEHFAVYMTRDRESADPSARPNTDLKFLKAHHFVLSYVANLWVNHKLRLELYYQHLFDVPVAPVGTFSILNLDELVELRPLVNGGTATNYGLDISFERYTTKGFYYLISSSLFNSSYTDISGASHRTRYDNRYKFNFLAGQEWTIGKKKGSNKLMGLNIALTALGGQVYTPIDLAASSAARETVLDETRPFEFQDDPLYIFDLTWTHTNHKARYTGTWAIQIKNMLQSAAPAYREYDALLDMEILQRGASILPIFSYRVQF
ncbi:MAG: TonB-dependent receptor [Bacteroidia bacterium]|nr:TonB-dependent receptor [Bacteroidia bacterium]